MPFHAAADSQRNTDVRDKQIRANEVGELLLQLLPVFLLLVKLLKCSHRCRRFWSQLYSLLGLPTDYLNSFARTNHTFTTNTFLLKNEICNHLLQALANALLVATAFPWTVCFFLVRQVN